MGVTLRDKHPQNRHFASFFTWGGEGRCIHMHKTCCKPFHGGESNEMMINYLDRLQGYAYVIPEHVVFMRESISHNQSTLKMS